VFAIRLGLLLGLSLLPLPLPLPLLPPMAALPLPGRQQAEALQQGGRFAEAAAAWQASLGSDPGLALDHDRALALVRLVICLRAAGADGRADGLYGRIRTMELTAARRGDGALPAALLALGMIENQRQQPELAQQALAIGYAISAAALGDDHERTRAFLWTLLAMEIEAQKQADAPPEEPAEVEPTPAERLERIRALARWTP